MSRSASGIRTRHRSGCRSLDGRRCNCAPAYQASVWDNAAGKCHVRTFPSYEAARSWRHEVLVLVRRRGTVAPGRYELPTVAEARDALVDGMRDGSVLDRSGKEYKPATVRSYEQASRRYLKPKLGRHRLDALERGHVQMLVDALRRKGLKPSTVHNKLDPLRVVYRRAFNRDLVATDPTANLELPLVRGRRERIVSRERARLFLDVLPEGERALWATALYGGLLDRFVLSGHLLAGWTVHTGYEVSGPTTLTGIDQSS